jgi:hypothetical protein
MANSAKAKRNRSRAQKRRWARQGKKPKSNAAKNIAIGSAATLGIAGTGVAGGVVLGRKMEQNAMSAVENKTKELTRRVAKGSSEGAFQGLEDGLRSRASQDWQTTKRWALNTKPAKWGAGLRSKLGFSLYDSLEVIEFGKRRPKKRRKPTSAATRRKISKGLEQFWDRHGSKVQAAGQIGSTAAGIAIPAALLYKSQKNNLQGISSRVGDVFRKAKQSGKPGSPDIKTPFEPTSITPKSIIPDSDLRPQIPSATEEALADRINNVLAKNEAKQHRYPDGRPAPGIKTQWEKVVKSMDPKNKRGSARRRRRERVQPPRVFDENMNVIGQVKRKPRHRKRKGAR